MTKSDEVILKVENLSKQYRLGLVGTGTLSHDLNRWWHRVRGKEDPYLKIGETNDRSQKGESEYVWALKDINFEVKRGEVLGIIGKNGAGKSTLLKILSKVTSPTTGSVKTRGRIASLLEVGTGFHGEMTGRENIYLNGAILGMTKKEIASKIDEIIDFSGCARYIDTPVKRYSSGMTVRLAFAVAAFLEPDILIVDEVLAVGDAEFQKKAIGKMQDISSGQGRTVLFVSHDMGAIVSLCRSTLLIEAGKVLMKDVTTQVVQNYLIRSNQVIGQNPFYRENNISVDVPKIVSISIKDELGNLKNQFNGGDKIALNFNFNEYLKIKNGFSVTVFIKNVFGEDVAVMSSAKMNDKYFFNESNVQCNFDSSALIPGEYLIRVVLHEPGEQNYDDVDSHCGFTILKHDFKKTGFDFSTIWKTKTFVKSEWE